MYSTQAYKGLACVLAFLKVCSMQVSTDKLCIKRFYGQNIWKPPRFDHFFLALNTSQHHYDANVH